MRTFTPDCPTAELRDNEDAIYEYYDSIEIASNITGNTHPKAAFQARNRMMVDRSDLVVFMWITKKAVHTKHISMP